MGRHSRRSTVIRSTTSPGTSHPGTRAVAASTASSSPTRPLCSCRLTAGKLRLPRGAEAPPTFTAVGLRCFWALAECCPASSLVGAREHSGDRSCTGEVGLAAPGHADTDAGRSPGQVDVVPCRPDRGAEPQGLQRSVSGESAALDLGLGPAEPGPYLEAEIGVAIADALARAANNAPPGPG